MKARTLARWLSRLVIAPLLAAGAASAAEVHVMISAGFYGVYAELAPAFERASGHRLVTIRGPSMGDSPEAIPTRLARGENADVVILDGKSADELGKRGLVRADSKVEFARSQIGMVVRAGAAKPDIGSVEAFRNALLAAKSIAYSDSGSGTYLSTTLFAKLGVADQVAGKSRKVRGPPSGEPVAAVVARSEAEIGFQQVSELIHVPGISFVGAIPAELQPGFSFAGAITSNARQPEAAGALIRFLASPEAAPAILKAGLTPPKDGQEDPRRFKLIPFTEMTPDQRKYADAVMAGPTSATGSAAVVPGASTIGSPFNVFLRSPLLADQLRRVSEHIRFKSSLPAKLNEFAILVTARQWGSQYEWFAHHRLALKAGLNPAIAEDLAQGKRPAGMQDDERAIYDFSQELHATHEVSDATYKAVLDRFGEQGVMDLIAVNGYYVLVSMVLNVDRTPMPGGAKPPLPQLK